MTDRPDPSPAHPDSLPAHPHVATARPDVVTARPGPVPDRPDPLADRLEVLTDRLEIADLLARYAYAIDSGAWDALDEVFTADAVIDYTSAGGIKGPFPEVKKWLADVLPHWPGRMHLIGAMTVTFDGSSASASVRASFTDALSPSREMVTEGVIHGGGWYHHTLIRTQEGWRSRQLVEEQTWRRL